MMYRPQPLQPPPPSLAYITQLGPNDVLVGT